MLQHADSRFLSAYQLGTKSAIAAVNLTQLLSSGIQDQQQNRQLAQSPLNSEGSTSATPPHIECTTTSEIGVQSSVWSEFLNGASPNSFMADNIDNVIPTSSSSTWWTSREQELQWNQSQQQQHQPVMSDLEGEWSPGQLGCLPAAPEVNEQLSNMTLEQNDYSSINTALVDPEISSNPSAWGSILMGGTGNDEHNSVVEGVEGLQEALFSKPSFLSDMKKPSDMQWDFNPLKGSAAAFELEHDMKHSQQFPLGGSSSHDTSDNWMNTRIGSGFSVDAFGNAQFNPCKIKQEMDNQFFSVNSNLRSEVFPTSNMNTMMNEIPSRWGAHSSRLPAMLSQVLPSTSTSSKPVNMFGNTGHMGVMSRPFGNYTPKSEPYKVQMEQSSMSQHSSITSQHSYDSKDSHTASKHMMEESREVSSDRKRGNDQASESFFKRPRVEQQQTPTLPFKATTFVLQVRKEKLGERITALQQLVAPFGKTDTASVLLEAIGYIKFLHEQVQVLSTPYMKNPATTPARPNEGVKGSSWSSEASKSKDSDEPRQDLRSRGLCLVPISCTQQVANDNGADYWTPNIGGSAK